MLLAVTLAPEVFILPGTDEQIQKLYYGLLHALLLDLTENGVVLVDSNNVLTGLIGENLNKWPGKYRKPLKELLSRLRVRSRFVKAEKAYLTSAMCVRAGCQHCNAIAEAYGFCTSIVCDDCLGCPGLAAGANAVGITDYPCSGLAQYRRQCKTIRLETAQWSEQDFDDAVLKPLLSTAKHIKIIDRYIGRSLLRDDGQHTGLSPRYRNSLAYFFDAYVRYCSHRIGSTFEVYCGLEASNYAPASVQAAKAGLKAWTDSVLAQFGTPVRVILKHERLGQRMPHARFLVTNQASLLVETGFDIFLSEAEMKAAGYNPAIPPRRLRDMVLSLCDDSARIQQDVNRLAEA